MFLLKTLYVRAATTRSFASMSATPKTLQEICERATILASRKNTPKRSDLLHAVKQIKTVQDMETMHKVMQVYQNSFVDLSENFVVEYAKGCVRADALEEGRRNICDQEKRLNLFATPRALHVIMWGYFNKGEFLKVIECFESFDALQIPAGKKTNNLLIRAHLGLSDIEAAMDVARRASAQNGMNRMSFALLLKHFQATGNQAKILEVKQLMEVAGVTSTVSIDQLSVISEEAINEFSAVSTDAEANMVKEAKEEMPPLPKPVEKHP